MNTYPSFVQFETTTKCNASCIMCPNKQIKGLRPEIMDEHLIFKILCELYHNKENVLNVLPFIYGEPLLYPNLIWLLVRIFEDLGEYKSTIYSNGSLLKDKLAEDMAECVEKGYCYIIFSVDGYQNYEKVRIGLKRDEVYKNILSFINMLSVDAKRKIRIEMCTSVINSADLNKFSNFWDCRGIVWNTATMDGRSGYPCPSVADLKIPCGVLWNTIYILSDGTVTPCCIDWKGKNNFGNINEQSITEIWNGKDYQELRTLHKQGKKNQNKVCMGCDRILGNLIEE